MVAQTATKPSSNGHLKVNTTPGNGHLKVSNSPGIYQISSGEQFSVSTPDIARSDPELAAYLLQAKRSMSQASLSGLTLSGKSSGGRSRNRPHITALTAHAKQNFSERKKKALANFSSLNYAPTHSLVYMNWINQHPPRLGWDRWILMVLIGLCIGLTATLLKQCLTALAALKWDKTKEMARDGDILRSFGWTAGISVLLAVSSSVLVAFVHPPAGGSGVPEVLAYLNGVVTHGTLGLKNYVVKFLSLVLSVSSGMPCAIQGPIVSIGAIVGVGVGSFKSKSLGFDPGYFTRFRTPEDRRSFTTAGLAAGVAAAFNAPIGGLLFAMEDLSSFWGRSLAWQTFFCCGIATATASVFNAAFNGFQFQGTFGLFSQTVPNPIPVNVVVFAPAIVVGIIGGFLGAIFTRSNTLIVKFRKKIISTIPHPTAQKFARVLEVVIITMIMAAVAVFLPAALECTKLVPRNQSSIDTCYASTFEPEEYDCKFRIPENATGTYYSEMATIAQMPGSALFENLIKRGLHREYDYLSLLIFFPIWFFMTAWTAGSAIAGGTFIPLLVAGSCYGRAIGLGVLDLYTYVTGETIPTNAYWSWVDPGLIATLGAGSLLGGVTRLNLAITVIIIEMSQDIDILVVLLVSNFVAKVVADILSKPLYKYQLDSKALPYLDAQLTIVVDNEIVNTDLYTAQDVMSTPVRWIHAQESVKTLAQLLIDTDHGGFPVVKYDENSRSELAYGLITRNELYVILCSEDVYNITDTGVITTPKIDYEEISVDYIPDPTAKEERVKTYARFQQYQNIYVNLEPYVNLSAPKVDKNYSLGRTYSLFRTLGLRHLMVIDIYNRVVGIITRKDLLPFNIEEKLKIANQIGNEEVFDLPDINVEEGSTSGSTEGSINLKDHETPM